MITQVAPLQSEIMVSLAVTPKMTVLPELNWLRALAGLMMIAGHAAFTWLTDEQLVLTGLSAPIFLITVGAPLFFTITGIGTGFQAAGPRGQHHAYGFWRKVVILYAADALLWFGPGRWIGMNFLGFIALSTVVLELVRRTPRPLATAMTCIVAVLTLRFVAGPTLFPRGETEGVWRIVAQCTGQTTLDGFAYAFCPWIAFPLGGFMLGWCARRFVARERAWWSGFAILATAAAVAGAAAGVMHHRGMVFFRWGTMSMAYFVFSWSIMSTLFVASIVVFHFQVLRHSLGRLLLRGIQCLALVPIHYLIIGLMKPLVPPDIGLPVFACLYLIVAVASFTGANLVKRLGDVVATLTHPTLPWIACTALFVIAVVLRGIDTARTAPLVQNSTAYAAQTGLCILLMLNIPFSLCLPWTRQAINSSPAELMSARRVGLRSPDSLPAAGGSLSSTRSDG